MLFRSNLLLMPSEHVLRRDVAYGAVQTDVVVMLNAGAGAAAAVVQTRCLSSTASRPTSASVQLRQDTYGKRSSSSGLFRALDRACAHNDSGHGEAREKPFDHDDSDVCAGVIRGEVVPVPIFESEEDPGK